MRIRIKPVRWWGYIACAWATAFAGLHYYWAAGGVTGLSVSSGQRLATERPAWFVAVGLWGVGTLCLVGAVLAWLLARSQTAGLRGRILRLMGWGVSCLLLARGIAVEVLLLTNATGLDSTISSGQRFWTLALWNPWFIAGGLAFGLAALGFGRSDRVGAGTAGTAGAALT